jgi:hypothetical protein
VYAVCRAGDDGHVICGDRRQPSSQRHLWVLRINADGEQAPPPVD